MTALALSACLLTVAPPAAPEPLMTRKGQPIFADDFAAPDVSPEWVRQYGEWAVIDGALKGGMRKADGHNGTCKMAFDFADAVVQFDLRFDGATLANFAVDSAAGHVGRLTIAPHGFTVQKDGSGTDPADPRRVLDTAAFAFGRGTWHTLTVEFCGDEVLARVDDRHFVLGADPKFGRAKTRLAFGVHGDSLRLDNVRAFAATPHPDWPATRARLAARHAPAPVPAVVGPDHYRNARNQKKRKAEATKPAG